MSPVDQLRALACSRTACLFTACFVLTSPNVFGQQPTEDPQFVKLAAGYLDVQRPLLQQFCLDCHSAVEKQGELDLEQFQSLVDVRKHPAVWQKVAEMLDNGEMPPKDAAQFSPPQRQRLRAWVQQYLNAEALASAGDPGPVVLRRLNNAEYTYSIQDLTGIPLTPTLEFPVDSAAGEGFTNTGNALVMSPTLLTKYLDAAREIAKHAVLLPDGIRFSRFTTRRDWTNEKLHQIRTFYNRYSESSDGDQVNLQGIIFQTNGGGRLPLEDYLTTLLKHRDDLRAGHVTLDVIAAASAVSARDAAATLSERSDDSEPDAVEASIAHIQPVLSPRYLRTLWEALENVPEQDSPRVVQDSILLNNLRRTWQQTVPGDNVTPLLQQVAQWQSALWKFTTVGHIGKVNGPKAWLEPVNPAASRQELRVPLTPLAESALLAVTDGSAVPEITLYLTAGDAGSASDDDVVLWERPRLVAAGRPDLLLRNVRDVTQELAAHRDQIVSHAENCLEAAAWARENGLPVDVSLLAERFKVDPASLSAWLDYIGIGTTGPVSLGALIERRMESSAGYDFIKGWVGDDALSIVANSSDQHVRIPGNMQPHSIAVHPAPTLAAIVGWKSPVSGTLTISGTVQHAHPECGNGTAWTIQLRRGKTRQQLASGISHGSAVVPFGPLPEIAVSPGDVVCLIISPRDGNHSCDLTSIDMTLTARQPDGSMQRWNMAEELSPDLLSGNPHSDQYGNADVWHFFSEPETGTTGHVIPAGSLLALWQSETDSTARTALARQLQRLLQEGVANHPQDSPDVQLYHQLTSISGPLLASALQAAAAANPRANEDDDELQPDSVWGLPVSQFGQHPDNENQNGLTPAVESASLCVRAPSVIEVRLPADLVVGTEFVTTATLHPVSGVEGSVQMQVLTAKPETVSGLQPASVTNTSGAGPWTSNQQGVAYANPVIVCDGSDAHQTLMTSFDDFRQLFPAALCYTRIVPVDEVVTLTLFYREDDHLRRLLLNDQETAELNRLWDELHFISRDALAVVDAYEQLMEFATQDADPSVFAPMRAPLNAAADEFRAKLTRSEPRHVDGLVDFASLAFRRNLQSDEVQQLRGLYDDLRADDFTHEESCRMLLQRILVSPSFLYRLETPPSGRDASPVNDWELASRLSYFLWSSVPDEQLRAAAASGTLRQPDVLQTQVKRMLADPGTRRMATECFCQWLQIYDFDQLDEKSEQAFPTFSSVRPLLYEEAILTFTSLLQQDGSILELFDADHTYLNTMLAEHYGIDGIEGSHWRRVEGVRAHSRGGILGMGAILAKQSGASRTSPILRGTWLSEVVLGEKLPKPPKGVPPLPDEVAAEMLTVRQLVERHTSDDRCSGCHRRIDPFGFSLESFDAIGRYRVTDSSGLTVDTRSTVPDGSAIDGINGLKEYLLTRRREAVVHQFCKKLLGYALGRAVQLSDGPLLQDMQQQLQQNDYRISVAIQAIVQSRQFREIRGRERTEIAGD